MVSLPLSSAVIQKTDSIESNVNIISAALDNVSLANRFINELLACMFSYFVGVNLLQLLFEFSILNSMKYRNILKAKITN